MSPSTRNNNILTFVHKFLEWMCKITIPTHKYYMFVKIFIFSEVISHFCVNISFIF